MRVKLQERRRAGHPTLTQPSLASERGLSSSPIIIAPIIIAAGGTGGHFFPAEALAQELIDRGRTVALMTDARSGGLRSAVFEGRDVFVLKGAGLAGRGLKAVGALAALAAGTVQARAILARLRPAVIVGFGGYPCVAPVLAAQTMAHKPVVILHEQNAVLGRANRGLARLADRLALGMDDTKRLPAVTSVVVGNPVRSEIRAGLPAPVTGDGFSLLVTGGSLGARVLSDVVPAAIALLPSGLRQRLSVVQQCRAEDLGRVGQAYATLGVAAELAAFFPGMAQRLQNASLVIGRAGASTVAELGVTGRPAILVPLPGAIDGHQLQNALASGAITIEQPDFTPERLAQELTGLMNDTARLRALGQGIAARGRPDAGARLADLVETYLGSQG